MQASRTTDSSTGLPGQSRLGKNARGVARVGTIRDMSALHGKLFATTAKKGYFQRACKARLMSYTSGKIVSNTLFLDSVDFHPSSHEPYVSIMLDDNMCRFRVDTGVDVTAILHELFT